MISFFDRAITIPEANLGEVGDAAHVVTRAGQDAGGALFGNGLQSRRAINGAPDGLVTYRSHP